MSGPDPDEQDINSFKQLFTSHMSKNPSLLNSSKSQEIVIFLGSTGSGKSTLLNFLSGIPLTVDEDLELKLQELSYPGAFAIGKSSCSETLFPQFVALNNSVYYDMPGFEDSRGGYIDLMNACFIKYIIERAISVKIVFVVGQDEITAGRSKRFFEVYAAYKKLIANSMSIENSSILVITKSVKSEKVELLRYLTAKVQANDLAGLKTWMDYERILPFSNKLQTNERLNILQAITDLEPINAAKVDIRPSFSTNVKDKVKKIIAQEFNDIFLRCQNDNISLNNSLDDIEEQITYFRSVFESKIDQLKNSSELLTILGFVSNELIENEYSAIQGNIQKLKYKALNKLKLLRLMKNNEISRFNQQELMQELEKRIKYLENSCSELSSENQRKEHNITTITNEKDQLKIRKRQKISTLKTQIGILDQDNQENIQEISVLNDENSKLSYQIKEKYDLECSKNLQLESLEALIVTYVSIISDLRKEKMDLQVSKDAEIENIKKQKKNLEQAKKRLKKTHLTKLRSLRTEIQSLKTDKAGPDIKDN